MPENNQDVRPNGVRTNSQRRRSRRVEVDVDAYQYLLDKENLTNEQRTEFLQAIWSIIVAFIDLGFDVHPVQQSIEMTEFDGQLANIANEFVRKAA